MSKRTGKRHISKPGGEIRRSQALSTNGPGALIDLIDQAVLVGGLDFWRYDPSKGYNTIQEPRLRDALAERLRAAGRTLNSEEAFREPPAGDAKHPSRNIGIDVLEMPQWFVCQNPECRALVRSDGLELKRGRYRHHCTSRKTSECVPVRFVAACRYGHLEEFPWISYAHRSSSRCDAPSLRLLEGATGDFSEINVVCECGANESLSTAMVPGSLPICRGERPWLGREGREECSERLRRALSRRRCLPRLPVHCRVLVRALQPLPRPGPGGTGDRSRPRACLPQPAAMSRDGLTAISRPDLEALLHAIEIGRLPCPVDRTGLIAAGLGALADHVTVLAGLDQASTSAVLEVTLAERTRATGSRLELVWTGPEARISSARDTAVVVRRLFAKAEKSVLIAGFCFDHGEDIFSPLHQVMRQRGVVTTIFLDIAGEAASESEVDSYAAAVVDRFVDRNWPFGEPLPAFYYDPRTVEPRARASLHAKCIVTDTRQCLISSANFTDRGQTRNIEAGVLIDDRSFATKLARQWQGLIDAGLVRRAR
jgi:hypothetical protein